MQIHKEDIASIEEVSLEEYNLHIVNVRVVEEFPDIRQLSKAPHFALSYFGTDHTLVTNCGFEPDVAREIYKNYQLLYKSSSDWASKQIDEASKCGYGIGAFGLKIRCPVIHKCIINNVKTPIQAASESRTLGNALSGQSYCLLNGRASNEFTRRVRASEYRDDIQLCAHIHDAIYLYVRDSIEVIHWVNTNLIECMAWQELPELQHEHIKLSSKLDIAYPTWADAFSIDSDLSKDGIRSAILSEVSKRKNQEKFNNA